MIPNGLSASEKYVVLALAANEAVESQPVVFHYFGPDHFSDHIDRWKEAGVEAIIDELSHLENSIPDTIRDVAPVYRRTYLLSQIRSLKGLLLYGEKKLVGDELKNAVEETLGMKLRKPYNMKSIRAEEDAVFTKHGVKTYSSFKSDRSSRETKNITEADLMDSIRQLKSFCRTDILPYLFRGDVFAAHFEASEVKVAKPDDGYPPCYYVYNGEGRGTISLTDDHHKKNDLIATRTLLHELMPGHHLYYLYREMLYKLGLLDEEATIDLLYSAETPVNEGIAETALFCLDSMPDDMRRDVEIATAHEHFCKRSLYNVWYHRYILQDMTAEEAVQFLKDETVFEPNENIERWLDFVDSWRLYYPSYPLGTDAVKDYLRRNPKDGLKYLYLPKTVALLDQWGEGANKEGI